ncbi:MAG: sigma-70 family RNA polymerase sigma factor [Oscillospiraceae bacterium]
MAHLSFDLCEDFVADDRLFEESDNKNKREYLKKIMKLIIANDLTQRQRELCVMYYFQKKKMTQIASELNVNKSTVSRTIATAIKNINSKMKYYKLR